MEEGERGGGDKVESQPVAYGGKEGRERTKLGRGVPDQVTGGEGPGLERGDMGADPGQEIEGQDQGK